MNKPTTFRIVAASLVAILIIFTSRTWTASAQAPSNDKFENATEITSLPYTNTIDTSHATVASDDPGTVCFPFLQRAATVWYVFTPAQDMTITTSTAGSNYATATFVYTGNRGNLSQVACISGESTLRLSVTAGATYHFMIQGTGGGPYPYPGPGGGGGNLVFSVSQVLPPPNDNFADSTIIPRVPYSNYTNDTTAATMEAGEPVPSCIYYGSTGKTIWYSYTPLESGSVTANTSSSFSTYLGVYTGNGLSSLVEKGCRLWGGAMTFRAEAGETYYIQVGAVGGDGGSLTFTLDVAPNPIADFYYYPSDASIFDTIQFNNNSYDPGGNNFPGGNSFQGASWNFGDGATSSDWSPNHRFMADGDYNIKLTVTTADGRTATVTKVVSVRTHDVAITKFKTPNSSKSGESQKITVSIDNIRYAETVQVDLYRSTPGGYVLVGSVTQGVPVVNSGKTTDFDFNYTFTSEDASFGKVTFKAVATLLNVRDTLSADNESIAFPTRLKP